MTFEAGAKMVAASPNRSSHNPAFSIAGSGRVESAVDLSIMFGGTGLSTRIRDA